MKRNIKIVVSASQDEVEALIGNHGAFSDCAGFEQELIKVNQRELEDGAKFNFSTGVSKSIYQALKEVVDSPRYPNKNGKEFQSICSFRSRLAQEHKRQIGSDINT
ncbi:hypothetical protein QFX18_11495 [Saccharophagus degradans]|uniref:hypothetical protein n=1 Tax=Saccharophagus degradans TaxID=86304 RepID=UPI002477EA2D|nr:hypothetical protein [Saccharophagus degradans]WGO96670.1 hypothetical protein QFX18_11495 [Saccharophagus degradans]